MDGWTVEFDITAHRSTPPLSPCSIQLSAHLNEFHRIFQILTSFFPIFEERKNCATPSWRGCLPFQPLCIGFSFYFTCRTHVDFQSDSKVYSRLSDGWQDTQLQIQASGCWCHHCYFCCRCCYYYFILKADFLFGLNCLSLFLFASIRLLDRIPKMESKKCNKKCEKKNNSNTFFGRRTRYRVRSREQAWTLLVQLIPFKVSIAKSALRLILFAFYGIGER